MKREPTQILFVCASLVMTALTNAAPNATVDAAKEGAHISPYIYGQFIEHIGNIMYRALWAELLDDRKFYFPVAPESPDEAGLQARADGGPARRQRGVGRGRWNPIGPADAVVMDTNNPFVGEHSPLVKPAGDEPRGICQKGVSFVKGTAYNGRIHLAGASGAKVFLAVRWLDAAGSEKAGLVVPVSETTRLSTNFQKFTFSFVAPESGPARFEIVGRGSGWFKVGAVSLMPSNNLFGFKPEAIAALKQIRAGVYRFPGGNFVSAHEWRDAIGDPDKRPPTWDPVWRAMQPNDIGTDEFMTLCKLLEVEPYITVNAGLGDAWSAAQYVEYANGTTNTPMGALRAANGHPEPYRVKFWGIGNEMWGFTYQFGAMKPEDFAFKHNQFAKAMRKVDASITLLASGAMPDTMIGSRESLSFGTNLVPEYFSRADWTGMLLSNCFDHFDMLSEHFYNYAGTHFDLAQGKQVPNDPNEPVTDWMRRPANHVRIKYEHYKDYERLFPRLAKEPKPLAISEWAYAGTYKYPTYPAIAWALHEMIRHSELIKMANYTFATALLKTDGTNVTLNANGLVFMLYSRYFGAVPVAVTGDAPQPKPTAPFGAEQPRVNAGSDTFPLDVVAAWAKDRAALTVAVLNPTDAEQSLRLKITGAKLTGAGTLRRLAPPAPDTNEPVLTETQISAVPEAITVPPFSISLYELHAAQ
ncbi:MAG: hypothetical protein RMH97_09925 [Verrucomicrobiales bacterium]|nr:hypothetical protein [Verrucomicrobiales bacterium]